MDINDSDSREVVTGVKGVAVVTVETIARKFGQNSNWDRTKILAKLKW